ncbi:MAG: hypothetical protein OEX05_11560, partial [Chloroflexota bacterium]|nr:hypothetical protein [Chloroflexota bacterium]
MTTVTNDTHGATRQHQSSGTDRPVGSRTPGRRAAGRRSSAVLVGLLLLALAIGVAPAPTVAAADYILMPRAELLALPTSGTAWTELKSVADEGLGTPDLCDQDSKHHLRTLASALVYARTGSAAYGTKARQGVMAAIETQRVGCDNATLALGRQLTAYVLAADFADLSGANDTAFRAWLGPIRTKQIGGHSVWTSLTITHTASAANWGAHAGASRIAAGLYLGDSADVAAAAKVTRGFLGDRSAYAGFTHKLDGDDLSWTCSGSQSTYTPENPPCTKSGIDVDGGFVTDISRGGPLHWPPIDPGIPYQLETIQGMGLQVELLYRHGYGDAWSWSSKALKRAAAIITRSGDAGGTGWNETSASRQMPWLLNLRYDTDIPTRSAGMGRSIGFTDWLYPPPPPPAKGATYVPLDPARLLDTRVDKGLEDPFKTGVVQSFQVTGPGSPV